MKKINLLLLSTLSQYYKLDHNTYFTKKLRYEGQTTEARDTKLLAAEAKRERKRKKRELKQMTRKAYV